MRRLASALIATDFSDEANCALRRAAHILDCAAKTDAELIVLGKHAAGIVEQLLIGSVALQVLEHARSDVLVVPGSVT